MADPYKSIQLNEFHEISSLKIVQQIDRKAPKNCLLSVYFYSLIFGHFIGRKSNHCGNKMHYL